MDLALALWRLNPAAAYRLTDDKTAILEWRGPGAQPTTAQLQAAWDATVAEQQQATTNATTTRNAVLTAAQSAVGVPLATLTATQVRALLACLLAKEGALNPDTTVKPLAQWVRA